MIKLPCISIITKENVTKYTDVCAKQLRSMEKFEIQNKGPFRFPMK